MQDTLTASKALIDQAAVVLVSTMVVSTLLHGEKKGYDAEGYAAAFKIPLKRCEKSPSVSKDKLPQILLRKIDEAMGVLQANKSSSSKSTGSSPPPPIPASWGGSSAYYAASVRGDGKSQKEV